MTQAREGISRGERKKRKQRAVEETQAEKEEKARVQKEESYGGGKQTAAYGWFCCRNPEPRQED